jgi:hypothetical protein
MTPAPDCPFYDAEIFYDQLIRMSRAQADLASNRCALITSAHSPCWMEVAENAAPDWAQCPRNPEYVTEIIRDLQAQQRFNRYIEYMDNLRVQRGIAIARGGAQKPA